MLSEKPWKPEAVLFLFVGIFLCILAGAVLLVLLHPKASESDEIRFSSTMISILGFHGAALVLTGLFVRKHKVTWSDAFGFTNRWKRSVLIGCIGALFFLPIAYATHEGCSYVMEKLSHSAVEQEAVKALRGAHSNAQEAVMLLMMVFIVPFVEEILFRGILYPLVKQAGYPRLALWGVSVFFGAMHFNIASFVPLVLMGLLLTFLYERTNNLLTAIATHSLFNAFGFVQLYLLNHQ